MRGSSSSAGRDGSGFSDSASSSSLRLVKVSTAGSMTTESNTQLVAKLFQNDDAGVAPLLKHPAGVVALSDAGAHLIYFCDAGFGLHFLAHWVRDTGTFSLEEGVRRLTSDPARRYRIPGRGTIETGNWADLVLFDPSRVAVSALQRKTDLPGGGTRMIRTPIGLHGVWVNGLPAFDGAGRVLRIFDS
jgi:N-acyl-D-amino-acid deacylase